MRRKLQRLLRHEGGMQVAEWVGVTAVVLCMVIALWSVFYGGPGRMLRATVGEQVTRYAAGFEGGLQTSGPSGGRPGVRAVAPDCGSGLGCALEAAGRTLSTFFGDTRTQGSLLGIVGAGVGLLAAGALGLLAGLPALVVAGVVAGALALGGLLGYLYAQRTGRADLAPILLLGFAGAGLVLVVGVGLVGAGTIAAVALGGALAGAGFEYAIQVYGNHRRGLRGWDAWAGQIGWGQVGGAALFGAVAGGVGYALAPALGAALGGSLVATLAGGVIGGGVASVVGQLALNLVTGRPWGEGLAEAGLLGGVAGGFGAVVGRAALRMARAMAGQRMSGLITAADGSTRTIRFQQLSGWSQGVVRQLEKRGWARVAHAPIGDMAEVSMFFGREIGLLQSSLDGRLRLVLGGERGVVGGLLRPGELFVAHTHPTFRSLTSHFKIDIAKAGKHTEAVVDWSGMVIYFNKSGVLNPTLRTAEGELIQAHPGFRPNFIQDGRIVGFPRIKVAFGRLGQLLNFKVPR
ncbi:MAG TPA: hypothetical protein VFS21_10850 [Roseiflexaceae bacterium]|nr:hypothetical protein [Roseiflexaceae bacterium]